MYYGVYHKKCSYSQYYNLVYNVRIDINASPPLQYFDNKTQIKQYVFLYTYFGLFQGILNKT